MLKKLWVLVLSMVAGTVLLSSCGPSRPVPEWMTKLQNKPDIIEGKGFAVVNSDSEKKAARDMAFADAMQKLFMAAEAQAEGVIETRTSFSREIGGDDKGKAPAGKGLEELDNLNMVSYKNEMKQRVFSEEYFDRGNKEYWVYIYLPAAKFSQVMNEGRLKAIKAMPPEKKAEYKEIESSLEADLQKYKDTQAK
ncbi:MAG: hypothetical protein WC955_04330 [Elusimicrobiota bacterium]